MKKAKYIIPALLLAAVCGACFFYMRPLTLSQLCPGVNVAQSKSVSGNYAVAPDTEDSPFEADESDARFSQIIALFKNRQFRRSLANLLPQGTKTHQTGAGDFRWDVAFAMDDVALPDGSVSSGTLIGVHSFYGTLEVRFNGDVWRCTTAGQDAWLKDVLALISSGD